MDTLNQTFHRLYKVMMLSRFLPERKHSEWTYVDKSRFATDYPFVFVAGFWSWGEYKEAYKSIPYWGFFTGNMLSSFNKSGFKAVAADVSPMGSAWDRACELYAQITGTVVDYGRAHSEHFGHPRYGEDFTGRGLLENFDEEHKINIIAHSFGCPTSALFAYLLENGSKEEQEVTSDGSLSPLFAGGNKGFINSITGLAGAYNGTSLVTAKQAIEDTVDYVHSKLPLYKYDPVMKLLEFIAVTFQKVTCADVPDLDTGLYDMVPEHSVELNKTFTAVDNVYYFTVPCQTTDYNEARKAHFPDFKVTDGFFALTAVILGRTNQETENGLILDKKWQPNDGLVNTVSERGPLNEECINLNCLPSDISDDMNLHRGKYYVFNTYRGSHNDLCGGTVRPNFKASDYIRDLMCAVSSLK